MIEAIISGVGLGLGIAIMLGPAFFSLLQTSIDRGFRNAIQFAIGIALSDAFLIAVTFLGISSLFGKPMAGEIVGLVGGGILIGIGIHTFLNRCKRPEMCVEVEIKEAVKFEKKIILPKVPRPIVFFVKGFLLNLANPAIWFFWIFWVGVISTQYTKTDGGLDIISLMVFFTCTLATILCTDILKAYAANQLKGRINDKLMTKVNMLFGLILIGFGVFLIIRSAYPIIELMIKLKYLQ
ncbi:MAG: LysE family transporter [Bacteroidales bacterium]|jgi:threonine/homoserine/homoserine lactone efflux protein|nr:LysE family transporter [Bacteroidales bacterium]